MTKALIEGVALLLALCFLHSINLRLWQQHPRMRQIMFGLLFGATCAFGMLFPLQLAPGLIFDARSVVLSMAALFGGPLPAAIATAIAAGTRWALGGVGAPIGMAVILSSSVLGLAYHYAHRRLHVPVGVFSLLLFGLLVHLVALGLFRGLDPAALAHVNETLTLPYLGVFTPATMLLGLLLQDMHAHTHTEARLQAIAASVPDLVLVLDGDGHYLEILSSDESTLAAPATQLIGRNVDDVLPPDVAALAKQKLRECLSSNQVQTLEYELQTLSGPRHFEGRCQPLHTLVRGKPAVVFITRDRTPQVRAEAELRESEQRYRGLLSDLPAIAVQGYDANGTLIFWNRASEQFFGWNAEEALGKSVLELFVRPERRLTVQLEIEQMFATGTPITAGETRLRRKDGSFIDVFVSHAYVPMPGEVAHGFSICIDISARKEAEDQARYLAYYDSLTGLPNRRLFTDRIQRLLGGRNPRCAALLFLDLDHFKTLNDSRGHAIGDRVLVEVASRLRTSVRAEDTVARLGGDEFVVLVPDVCASVAEAANSLRPMAEKLLERLRQPYTIGGEVHHLTASIGVAIADSHAHPLVDDLLKHADLAMYRAKDEGRNTLRFFDPQMQAAVDERARLQSQLHQGISRHEFLLFLQPQVTQSGRIIGAEALLRWQQPDVGVVSPARFIPLAEETGLILTLGRWALESGLRQQARWQSDPALASLNLSINVSARQFHHEGFVETLRTLLERSGADPAHVTLELTESVLLHNMDEVVPIMQQVRALGLCLSLDDFGTGYSSLGYLNRLPLNEIKIDQGFVRGMLDNPTDAAIAQSIVTLAQTLGLNVIAEGVETQAHHDFLHRHGCRIFQGYLFGRPMPIAEFEQRARREYTGPDTPVTPGRYANASRTHSA